LRWSLRRSIPIFKGSRV